MKFALLFSFFAAFNLHAASVRVNLDLEVPKDSSLASASARFVATNPVCKDVSSSPWGTPSIRSKTVSVPAGLKVLNDRQAVVTFDSKYPHSNICNYRLNTVAIKFNSLNWIALSSTLSEGYHKSLSALDMLSNTKANFTASCEDSRCKALVDGKSVQPGVSNLMNFFLNAEILAGQTSKDLRLEVIFR